MAAPFVHVPVMLREVMEALAPFDEGLYVDGTFGRGGYTRALLEAAETKVIGIDRDPDAIKAGEEMVKSFSPRLRLLQGIFGDMQNLLAQENVPQVDGIVLDIGVSSPQIDNAARGFSFQEDGPLDMRMSQDGQSAADIVNTASESELADIIFHFGEERYARRVARHIVEVRKTETFVRTKQLADLVRHNVPRSKDGVDPATRTFQALRIAVNDELGELDRGLSAAEALLKPEGKLAIVAFHSLEDRRVKEFLRDRSGHAPRGSRHAPANESTSSPSFHLLSRKPLTPSEEEIAANPRARSARLRLAQRTDAPPLMENAA
ncbi:MAG TPA: 16S rRNA (cytosine(1402)-N(4))-methyltransferase [Rhodospirillaceae bacterium]|nr:16S rRNA (cytosine(1402)-N(4))-methyltransferase [Rhodospirillaceae bacterium]